MLSTRHFKCLINFTAFGGGWSQGSRVVFCCTFGRFSGKLWNFINVSGLENFLVKSVANFQETLVDLKNFFELLKLRDTFKAFEIF